MLRAVLAVAVAVALLGVALPAVDRAAVARGERLLAGEAAALAGAAEELAAGSDPVPPGARGARAVVELRLPGRSWASAPVDYLAVGAVPDRPSPGEQPSADTVDRRDDDGRDVVAYRVAGGRRRVVEVGFDVRSAGGAAAVVDGTAANDGAGGGGSRAPAATPVTGRHPVAPDDRPLVLREPGRHVLALRLVRVEGHAVVVVRRRGSCRPDCADRHRPETPNLRSLDAEGTPMRAHAPGSVTGLFAPATEAGGTSTGASFAVDDGVVVEVTAAEETAVTVDGEPAPFEPVERVLDDLGVAAAVDVRPEVPLGHGFGASGAATLATALAADATFDLDTGRGTLLQAAHRAELAAGTGQGDVFIQERGGLVWSGDGDVQRVAVDAAVEYATAGGIDTSEMLADDSFMAAARASGREHLAALSTPPDLRGLAERSRAYLADTGIATAFVEEQLDRVEAAGGAGSMALFGDTVFAVDVADVLASRTRVANEGARLLDGA